MPPELAHSEESGNTQRSENALFLQPFDVPPVQARGSLRPRARYVSLKLMLLDGDRTQWSDATTFAARQGRTQRLNIVRTISTSRKSGRILILREMARFQYLPHRPSPACANIVLVAKSLVRGATKAVAGIAAVVFILARFTMNTGMLLFVGSIVVLLVCFGLLKLNADFALTRHAAIPAKQISHSWDSP